MPTSKASSSSVAVGNITGIPADVSTFLATPSSANLASAMTDETGTTNLAFATSPTLVTPALGTPASGVLTNCTGTASGLTAGTVTNGVYTTGDQSIGGNKTFTGDTSFGTVGFNGETPAGKATFINDVVGIMGGGMSMDEANAINGILTILKLYGMMASS